MQVLEIDAQNTLNIKFALYSFNNEVESYRDRFEIENNTLIEIDNVTTKKR